MTTINSADPDKIVHQKSHLIYMSILFVHFLFIKHIVYMD